MKIGRKKERFPQVWLIYNQSLAKIPNFKEMMMPYMIINNIFLYESEIEKFVDIYECNKDKLIEFLANFNAVKYVGYYSNTKERLLQLKEKISELKLPPNDKLKAIEDIDLMITLRDRLNSLLKDYYIFNIYTKRKKEG